MVSLQSMAATLPYSKQARVGGQAMKEGEYYRGQHKPQGGLELIG